MKSAEEWVLEICNGKPKEDADIPSQYPEPEDFLRAVQADAMREAANIAMRSQRSETAVAQDIQQRATAIEKGNQ